jgi:hypothetical protein
MKFMVHMQVTEAAGKILEQGAGPGPIIGRVLERFKAESVYMCPTKRQLWFVAAFEPADMAELMIAGSEICGQYPEFSPVVPAADFGAVVGKAIPGAKKLLNG